MTVIRSRKSSAVIRGRYDILKFELKSLEDLWIGLFLVALQISCFVRACRQFKDFKSATWEPFARPSLELGLYLTFICIAIICMPIFAFTSIFKMGSYANDNFKLGMYNFVNFLKHLTFTIIPGLLHLLYF